MESGSGHVCAAYEFPLLSASNPALDLSGEVLDQCPRKPFNHQQCSDSSTITPWNRDWLGSRLPLHITDAQPRCEHTGVLHPSYSQQRKQAQSLPHRNYHCNFTAGRALLVGWHPYLYGELHFLRNMLLGLYIHLRRNLSTLKLMGVCVVLATGNYPHVSVVHGTYCIVSNHHHRCRLSGNVRLH